MLILVVYGSKNGGTAGLAEMVGGSLRARDVEVEVRDAASMPSVAGFDAVIVGGALYAGIWNKNSRVFVKRRARELGKLPVFFFSSGPLDDSATTTDIPPVGQVKKLMDRVGSRGHATFGGRLEADAEGFMASKVAERSSGDFRDADHVDRWVASVVNEIGSGVSTPSS